MSATIAAVSSAALLLGTTTPLPALAMSEFTSRSPHRTSATQGDVSRTGTDRDRARTSAWRRSPPWGWVVDRTGQPRRATATGRPWPTGSNPFATTTDPAGPTVPAPTGAMTDPSTGTTDPSTGTTDPSTGTTDPSTGTTVPSTGTTVPSTGTSTSSGTPTTTEPTGAPSPSAGTPYTSPFAPPLGRVYLGVSTDWARMDTFDAAAGLNAGPAIYNRWTTPDGPFAPILTQVAQRPGLTPMVSWNLPLQNGQITDGSMDSYILAQADATRAYAGPVFVRLDWEMNGYWYPKWNLGAVTPAEYVASWRHVVGLFHAAGVTNAAFVWAPNALSYFSRTGARVRTSAWYPGDDVVDWIGLDAYPQSATPAALVGGIDGMNDIAAFAVSHDKRLMLAEWAPNLPHPDTADPVNLVFDWAQDNPVVGALVYFDFITQGRDFTLVDHPVGAAAYRARTHDDPTYLTSVVR